MINKAIVNLSRHVALVGTTFLIFGVCAYFAMQGYFGLGHSWAVPLTLSASDDKALELNLKVDNTIVQLSQFDVDDTKQRIAIQEMQEHKAQLITLEHDLDTAVQRETDAAAKALAELSRLEVVKRHDIARTDSVLAGTDRIAAQLQNELGAGLITKTEYASGMASVNTFQSSATDAKIDNETLRAQIVQRTSGSTALLDIRQKQIELRSEIAQLDNSIIVARETLAAEHAATASLSTDLGHASGNPYSGTAAGKQVDVLFVPYENKLKPGDPIFNCILGIVGCYRVGNVQKVFAVEQLGQNPAPLFFKTPVRGYTVSVHFDTRKDAESKILFASKPVGF